MSFDFQKRAQIWDNHCHLTFPEDITLSVSQYEGLIAEMGLSRVSMLACPLSSHSENGYDVWENIKMLYMKANLSVPSYAYFAFTEYPDDPSYYVQFAQRMLSMGFDGFKSLEMQPSLRKKLGKGLNAPCFEPFFAYWEQTGRPMVCHVGNPRPNWTADAPPEAKDAGRVYDETYPTLDELYAEIEAVIARHPGIPVILAHFYFCTDRYEHLEKLMVQNPNVYLDLTPGGEMFAGFTKNIPLWREFFFRYRKRILLGSDQYARGMGRTRYWLVRRALEGKEPFLMYNTEPVTPLTLPDDMLDDIYFNNAYRLLNEPAPLCFAPIREELIRLKRSFSMTDTQAGNAKIFEKFFG